MKLTKFIFIGLTGLLFSCSSSDDSNNGSNNNSTPFALSLEIGNYWNYDVTDSSGNTFRDSLFISKDTLINGINYKKFETDGIPAGFYSSTLNNNGVRKDGNKLLITGDFSVNAGTGVPVNLDLSVVDFVIFDADASNNQMLNSQPQTGNIQQTVQGVLLDIDYELNTYGGETLATYDVNGITYSNVKTSKVKVTMTIGASYQGVQISNNILTNNEVLVATQYVAENIGVIYNDTQINVNLNAQIATLMGTPQNTSQQQNEKLDTYSTN
ncbi:hypothetical protein ACFS5J_01140 [Flavobacterium chuncheonense]|uniref:Lipoprotein n=1 Tax=Flavobacterium chuncheonense TaxID=2026653 RepID=A0ABW5YJP3_9FLAO